MQKGKRDIPPKSTQKLHERAQKKVCPAADLLALGTAIRRAWTQEILTSTDSPLRGSCSLQQLSSKINNSIEKQMVQAASSGKLTIMKASNDLEA